MNITFSCVTRSLVLRVMFCRSLFVLLSFSFGGCVVCTFDHVFWWMCCLLLTLSFGECVVCTVDPVFWWMCCLYFWPCLLVDVLSVILTLSFGGCVVRTSIYGFWLPLWCLQSLPPLIYANHFIEKNSCAQQSQWSNWGRGDTFE